MNLGGHALPSHPRYSASMSEPEATTSPRSALVIQVLVGACICVPASILIGPLAAVIRYATGVNPWLALALGSLCFGAGALVLLRSHLRFTLLDLIVIATITALTAWVVRAAMFLPGFDDLATIGGGDAGNHLTIASAWATTLPKIYLGFTGQHALLFAVDKLIRHDLVHALSDVHRMGLWSGLCGLGIAGWGVIRPPRDTHQWRSIASSVVALLLSAWLLQHTLSGTSLLLGHYLQVEGFFPHAFAIAPLAWTLAIGVWVRPWPLRTLFLALGVVLLRFTYGLQLGDLLLGCSAALAFDAYHAKTGRQRWVQGLGALVCGGGGGVALVTLWGRRLKTGGVQHFDVDWTLEALALFSLPLMGLVLSSLWSRRRLGQAETSGTREGGGEAEMAVVAEEEDTSQRRHRLAGLSLGFVVPSVAMLLATSAIPESTRGYYLWKYPMSPLMLLAALTPFICGAIAAHAMRQGAGRRGMLLLLATLCSVATFEASHHTTEANSFVARTWQERHDETRPLRRLHPLLDRHVLQFIAREVTSRGRTLTTLVHNRWPAFNATMSAVAMWKPPPIERAPQIQMQRYPAFIRGAQPSEGTCVAWMETKSRRLAVLRSKTPRGAPLRRWLQTWRRDKRRRCETYTPHWAASVVQRMGAAPRRNAYEPLEESVCVLCGAP